LKNWKKTAKDGAVKIGKLFFLGIIAFFFICSMAVYMGIIPGIVVGTMMASFLSNFTDLSSEAILGTTILVGLLTFLYIHFYYKENNGFFYPLGIYVSQIIEEKTKEN